jgi:hypothetical protein
MTQQNPITPPPGLVQQWTHEYDRMDPRPNIEPFIATRAAQWGADQELEACCEWLGQEGWSGESRQLRAARRPKPPRLKEQSIALIDRIQAAKETWDISELETIRRALEQLPDNE